MLYLREHGDSEFAAWSMTHISGIHIDDYCPVCSRCDDWEDQRRSIEQSVRTSAYHIIDYKGATYYAIGMALVRITQAIMRNERSMLTVSTVLHGEYGLQDVSIGVPCVVAEGGVESILEAPLSEAEIIALTKSGDVLKAAINSLK
jgi:L-lactate dehydrogenase